MTWCDDNFAILQDGWSGNSVPVPVPKSNLGLITAYSWIFDRKIPASPEARKALAIYREGRNAEQNYLISYAVLCYYKIVELKYRGKAEARSWFGTNYAARSKTTTRLPATLCGSRRSAGLKNRAIISIGRVASLSRTPTSPFPPIPTILAN
jgi:hypothetical protein